LAETLAAVDFDGLLVREAALRAGGATPPMRDAAVCLGVLEAALIEARRRTGAATPLRRPDVVEGFGALVSRLGVAGEMMALTRNDACVHEKRGRYAQAEFHGAMGQVVGDIDLRLFTRHWRFGYDLREETGAGPRRSLQFFDAEGTAIHKVYATDATDLVAFDRLVADAADPAAPEARFEPVTLATPETPDAEIDAAGFVAGWRSLGHSHDFAALLRRFGVSRAQAMRLGGPDLTRQVGAHAERAVLNAAARDGLPIMVFVGNPGCVQIHSGPVSRIEVMGPWLNVLDPRFNLHLREDRIAAAFVVRKPSLRGDVHSLELYDAAGACIAQIFGERPPGGSERDDWRALLAALDAPTRG